MNITLKDVAHGPIYAQIREQIENQIRNGQITSGHMLIAPAALSQQLAVDRGEIQRAYYELEHAGVVTSETRKDFLGKSKTTYRVK